MEIMGKTIQRRRRPRALSLTLPDAKKPFLSVGGQHLILRNFSQDGIGVWVKEPFAFPLQRGVLINAELVIEAKAHPVELEVCHRSGNAVGLKITHQSETLRRVFRDLLRPTAYASEIAKHPESGQEDKLFGGHPRLWYADNAGTELLVWYQKPQNLILGVQLCWLGRWAFRRQFQLVQTGALNDGTRKTTGVQVSKVDLISEDHPADAQFLFQVAQFLTSVSPPLPGHLLWQFLETGEQVFLPSDAIPLHDVA